jgi:dihydroorotase
MKDMLNVMSKYMAMGMELNQVIATATWNAAKAIRHEELGNLSVGSVADIAVIRIRDGNFGFVDAGGNSIEGKMKLEAELTIRSGTIVWDLNGISAKKFK